MCILPNVKLLLDSGDCYVASELKQYLKTVDGKHVHGKLMRPQTQGRIERCHRSLKK
ncbi:transposase family protein [Flavisolibacter ginsenosidimutans]|uniref:Transposase family protein n=1 Tax=Flavisolibacter ginsenosidimutans TaxID=661481 RepID=A0A5B8UPS6_9BACT|nr:transposase family protein [Flavisolibacter ginsenosidimutans]